MNGLSPVNFILMANTLKIKNKVGFKTFDLKGSIINRKVVRGENQTLKDQNLLFMKKNRQKRNKKGILQFNDSQDNNEAHRIREILRRDAEFLRKCRLLDYSVLLGIERIPKKKKGYSLFADIE